jgi:phosphate-selective porin
LGRGGAQTGYLLGFNWYASDYVRFMVNYGRINVEGGPLAALVLPASTDPVNQRDYSVDSFVARLQMEF